MEHLNELDKEEFRLVAKKLDRHYSDEKFDADWAEFQAMKAKKAVN